jgi:hypothetical protein
MVDNSIQAEGFDEAINFTKALIHPYRYCMPLSIKTYESKDKIMIFPLSSIFLNTHHPLVAINYTRLGKLLLYKQYYNEAKEYLEKVRCTNVYVYHNFLSPFNQKSISVDF